MDMKNLASIFPNASQAFLDENQQRLASRGVIIRPATKNDVQGNVGAANGKRGDMNKTESEFALMLEAQKRAGEILRYEYEGITLRWADMRYTPDFIVFYNLDTNSHSRTMKLIEVKGGHIWDRDIVRFKGARAYWPEFQFEMHQKTKDGWKRKL